MLPGALFQKQPLLQRLGAPRQSLIHRAPSMARIHALRDRIGQIPGVSRITTHVVMAGYINAFADD